MKEKMDKPKPRMAIVVEDGIVQSVHADHDVDVLVVDYDDNADDPVLYGRPTVERDPRVIEELAKEAQAFMDDLQNKPPSAMGDIVRGTNT